MQRLSTTAKLAPGKLPRQNYHGKQDWVLPGARMSISTTGEAPMQGPSFTGLITRGRARMMAEVGQTRDNPPPLSWSIDRETLIHPSF